MTIAAKRTRVLREIEPRSASPQRAFGRIEIPQRTSACQGIFQIFRKSLIFSPNHCL
jgi:hypothetical protein